jgi:hypothetical protein
LTIAVCYVSPEGVVLGADSTSSYFVGSPNQHYFNHAQKLFEIGEGSTFGIVTWGLGGLQNGSYRTMIARLDDEFKTAPPQTVEEVAQRWVLKLWPEYLKNPLVLLCQLLAAKTPYAQAAPGPAVRTEQEEFLFNNIRFSLVAGFCIGGYSPADRVPEAFEVIFDPLGVQPQPTPKGLGYWFWGAPNIIQRMIYGCDERLKDQIVASGKWGGTRLELDQLSSQFTLSHPVVPIRDAIDFVHTCIESTIKAIKFSNRAQICGGPIEIAVITTDRRFRRVRHKAWDTAIIDGDIDA